MTAITPTIALLNTVDIKQAAGRKAQAVFCTALLGKVTCYPT